VEVVGAGRLRGIVLHKLMEVFLTGELKDDEGAAVQRAAALLDDIEAATLPQPPDPQELGRAAYRTLHLPEIEALRPSLVAEVPMWERAGDDFLAARGDAVGIEGDTVTAVIDWKSDVEPSAEEHSTYVGQVEDYCRASGAPIGAIVYMTRGNVHWVKMPNA
jgi:hypothetical protein